MKTPLLLGLALGTLLVTTAASAAKTTYTAEMTGAKQLPPIAGEGNGHRGAHGRRRRQHGVRDDHLLEA